MTNLITTWQSAHNFSNTAEEGREVFVIELRRQVACMVFSIAFGLCRLLEIERDQIDLALSQAEYESDVMDSI
jgi:hypothetical protein